MKAFRFKGAAACRRREELGLTAQDLADAVGVTPWSIWRYERDTDALEPSAARYLLIVKALQVDPDDLREPRDAAA